MVCSFSSVSCLFRMALIAAIMVPACATAAELTSSRMLRINARAAAESGDFTTAAVSLRDASRMDGDNEIAERAAGIAERLEGGSGQADFGPLIELIMEQTSPPAEWIDNDGSGGSITPFEQGVFVGGPAVLASVMLRHDSSRLDAVAKAVSRANRNVDVREASDLRLVSLPRLEQHVAMQIEQGGPVTDDLRNLAGLSRVEYLFAFPESGDVVIGGPAADWVTDGDGRTVSVADGRPVLQLDDLVTLGRTFSADGEGFFRCSIDPKRKHVQAVNNFVRKNRKSLTKQNAAEFTQHLEEMLGLQNVIVNGVPRDSRVAQVIVDADYRMKQIGIGDLEGVPGMKSYFELLSRAEQRRGGSMDALRWWMAVGYDAIQMSPTGEAFEFAGNSVRCLAEDQIVNEDGSRSATGKARGANRRFAELFTEHFAALTQADRAFADLENVFDLAMVAALVHFQGLSDDARLNSVAFRTAGTYQPAAVDVPAELMTAAAHRVPGGRHIVVQVAGGVRGDMASVVADSSRFREDSGLRDVVSNATPQGHSIDRWWWDAARK